MMQLGESPGVALVCLRHCSPRGQALRVAQRCARMWLLKELQLDHDPVPEDAVPSRVLLLSHRSRSPLLRISMVQFTYRFS